MTSRLANYYPERFLAFGFVSVAYVPPSPDLDVGKLCELTKEVLGYEEFGYWCARSVASRICDLINALMQVLHGPRWCG